MGRPVGTAGLIATALAITLAACALGGCTTSHVDNPAVSAPPSVSFTATATAPTVPAPCAAATVADVQAAFGGTVDPGSAPAGGVRPECQWAITGSNLKASGTVVLYYPPVQSSAAFHAAEDGLSSAVKVHELGDAAYYDPAVAALTVLVGERQFVVQGLFRGVAAGDLQGDLVALAGRVETRL